MPARSSSKLQPTEQTYEAFQRAYRYFNHHLFNRRLPNAMITLHRKSRSRGYFHAKQYSNGSASVDNIAMNPDHFRNRTDKQVLSTLVHEMCHLWQEHYGHTSRSTYHNAQFADKMLEVGLCTSDTGLPGGARTGQQMTHYIIESGLFSLKCDKLIAKRFKIVWYTTDPAETTTVLVGGLGGDPTEPQAKSGSRSKFSCPTCGASAWGKPSLSLICGDCHEDMVS
jgi:predicted SprT family Zn-dependent metalloprotease